MGLLLCAIWLYYLGGYKGFFHDATLYGFLAQLHQAPGTFARDLFAGTGTQGQFTAFPALYAFVANHLGLGSAAFFLTVAGLASWYLGLTALARRSHAGWSWCLAVICVVTAARSYDAAKVFTYSESFLTPRLFAEGFCLAAMTQVLQGRYLRTLGCLACAALCHPLMAAYPILLALVLYLRDPQQPLRRRLALGGCVACLTGLLIGSRISVFAGLFVPYDAEWYAIIAQRVPYLLLDNWGGDMAGRIVYLALTLLICGYLNRTQISRHAKSILSCAVVLLAAWAIGGVLWHDQFLSQLQPWRCIWLWQILTLIELGHLLWHRWQGTTADRWLAAMMSMAWLQAGGLSGGLFDSGWLAAASTLAGLLLYKLLPRLSAHITGNPVIHWLPLAIPLPFLLENANLAVSLEFFAATSPDAHSWHAMAQCASIAAGICFALWLQARIRGKGNIADWLCMSIGAVALAISACNWSEPFWRNNGSLQTNQNIAHLQQRIPPTALVLSDKGLNWTWFILKRSAYVSNTQLASVALSRQTATLGAHRMQHLCASGFPDCGLSYADADAPSLKGKHLGTDEIRQLCADPDLDIVLLGGQYPAAETFRDERGASLSLLDCAKQRTARK